jgi:hypothetical protein
MTPELPVQESLSPPYPIIGYRDLSQGEGELINTIKEQAELTRALVERVREVARATDQELAAETEPLRWLNIARTHLQQGYMALTRAVAKPTTF